MDDVTKVPTVEALARAARILADTRHNGQRIDYMLPAPAVNELATAIARAADEWADGLIARVIEAIEKVPR